MKIRPWQDRLVACGQVQRALFRLGYPAPELIFGPESSKGLAISAEAMVEGGGQLTARPDAARLFAFALHRLVVLASRVQPVGSLDPSPPWVAWNHPGTELWPAPDDREGDLNRIHPGDWLDGIALAVRERLAAFDARSVVGHGDWYSQNLDWVGPELRAAHDWDSVVEQPEAAIAGQAAAVWPATGGPSQVASIEQTEAFLDGYSQARAQRWTADEVEVAWAPGLWNRAFDAKKALLVGDDPDLILARSESADRSRRAGI